MNVKEMMTSDPACCTADTPLTEVAKMMKECDCGCIPVVDDMKSKKPVGMITDRDITIRTLAEGRNPMDMKASDAMTTNVMTVTPENSLEECCNLMEEHQIRRVAVVDQDGSCCGMIAQADIAVNADSRKTAEVVQEVSKGAGASA